MITHRQALDALTTLNDWFEQEAMSASGANERELADIAAVEALEHEIHGQALFTVVANWVPSRERWSAEIWAANRQEAEANAMAQAQATWEAAGMEGRAQFLIAGTFLGKLQQADVGAKTSDD